MLSTILVPLDGSACSERAVPYAQRLASASGAQFVFVRAVGNVHGYREAENYLAQFVNRVTAVGLHARAAVRADGPAASIIQTAKDYDAELVVMSTHGRGGLKRMVWGSVADLVLRHISVPILMVPLDADFDWSRRGPSQVITPLDGSALAEQAIQPAQTVARATSAPLVLLRAVEPTAWLTTDYTWPVFDPYGADPFEAQITAARGYLEDVARSLGQPPAEVRVDVYKGGAAAAIRRAAQDRHGCIVAMATHGRGGVSRAIFGSVTDAVLRTAQVPMLIVRPAAVAARTLERANRDIVNPVAPQVATVA